MRHKGICKSGQFCPVSTSDNRNRGKHPFTTKTEYACSGERLQLRSVLKKEEEKKQLSS